ncbi:MAG: hypothetical protein UX98_C0003G0022 [Parcubacteria group bacterium GW2011_GWA2_47_26]|nr:MAG: hypothetical protein UX98_C0003G0022 [Parcubacteria group bacterium GW2011_GWA2_47_26]
MQRSLRHLTRHLTVVGSLCAVVGLAACGGGDTTNPPVGDGGVGDQVMGDNLADAGGDNTHGACDNWYAGSCMAWFFDCFRAEGACTIHVTSRRPDGGVLYSEACWDSGSRVRRSSSDTIDFYSPEGRICASFIFNNPPYFDFTFRRDDGREYRIAVSHQYGWRIYCPDGRIEEYSEDIVTNCWWGGWYPRGPRCQEGTCP